MCTAIAGALLLGEKFTKREAFAGRECLCFELLLGTYIFLFFPVVSLVGVVLIARPTALFGHHAATQIPVITDAGNTISPGSADVAEKGTPRERLIAVGYACSLFGSPLNSLFFPIHQSCSYRCPRSYRCIYEHPRDRKARAPVALDDFFLDALCFYFNYWVC